MPVSEGIAKLAGAEQKRLGMPEDLHWYSAAPFGTMNQQDSRTRLEDTEFFWVENFLLTGKAKLRTLWDQGAALYTAPTGNRIVYFSWFNINDKVAVAVFLADGSAYSVDFPSGTATLIGGTPGLFYTGGQLPFAVQSGDRFLLIANNNTPNDYWVWDGTLLYAAGQLGPYQTGDITDAGSGYTSAPTLTIFGGQGTGATATATIFDGSVVAITITDPGAGYAPSDSQVQVAFTGGGSDNGAILTALLSPGDVDHVELVSGGSGYTGVPTVGFTGGGGGTGAAATAVVTNDVVTAINMTDQGTGYVSTPTVTLTGGGGSGASAVAVLSPGFVASIQIDDGGTGYTGTPTLTFQGGGGSGAAATAILSNGSITGFSLSSGGSGYTSPPTIVVQTGLNKAAAAVIDVMPFGVSGTSIETFQSRVWLSNPSKVGPIPNGGVINVSTASSITNFATSAGGDLFTNSDRYLRERYIALHQSNGYLYPIGDSSVSVISNVQTNGNPPTTTFNYQNTSDQIGSPWRDTVQDYGQSIIFANANGIQGLYGGAVQRISKKLDDIFVNAFPRVNGVVTPLPNGVTPSGAVMNIYTIPVYLLNLTLKDPVTKQQRTVMIGWNEREFFIGVQKSAMIFIGTQEVNSVMTAWGTDSTALYPLFAAPSSTLPKRLVSKLWGADQPFTIKTPLVPYIRGTDKSAEQAGIPLTLTMESTGEAKQVGAPGEVTPSYAVPNIVQPNFLAPDGEYPVWAGEATAVAGTALGITVTSAAPDFELNDLTVAYRLTGFLFG